MTVKKPISVIICIALLAGLFVPAAAAGAKYVVAGDKANVLPEPSALTEPIAEIPRGTVVDVTEIENNFGHIFLRSTGIDGWVHMSLLRYIGDAAGNTDGVKSIYIKSLPEKTVYIEGEEVFDPAGLTVYAVYEDRPDAPVTGYILYLPSFSAYGEKTVYVSYTAPGGAVFTAEFTVTVNKVPLAGITIVSPPDKTEYIEGETLDFSGLQAELSYTDGRGSRTVTYEEMLEDPDFLIMGCHSEAHGKKIVYGSHTVNIYYKYPEVTCYFTLNAVRKTLLSLQIDTMPDSTVTYSTSEPPDLTGLTLTAEYDNGDVQTVYPGQCRVLCDPESFVLGSGNIVTVQYGGLSVTLDFTLAIDSPGELQLELPAVMNFILGEPIDLTSLKVYMIAVSGEKTEVSNYTMGEIDPTTTGTQTIPIRYDEFSALFTININPYYQRGDPDGDGKPTASDARIALRASVGLVTLAGNPKRAADIDGDGTVTASDARMILRAAVGLENLIDYTGLVLLPKKGGTAE